ncbi:MAG: hypothetical protein AAF602_28260, partial [Myxococcota bacterium]
MNRVFYVLVMAAFVIAGVKFFTAPAPVPLLESHRDQLVAAVDASPERMPEGVARLTLAKLATIADQSSKFTDGRALVAELEARGRVDGTLYDALLAKLDDRYQITRD